MYKMIEVTRDERVATVAINRPEVSNAISKDCIEEILSAVLELDADPDVGAIVLTGKGKHFSSGGDIQRFKMLIETKQYLGVENIALADRMASALRNCAKPVIAMVNGVATGAGLSCALACDFRVVSPSSKLIMGFINMGLPGDTGSIYMLLRLLGPERASKMMMTGDIVSGEEAVACGLASILAGEGELESSTYAFAKKLASKSNAAMAAQKRLINKYFYGEELETFYKDEQREMVDASHLPDFTEAVYAFLDKRKPVFNQKQ